MSASKTVRLTSLKEEVYYYNMKYDFDTVIDRKNTASLKWDVKEGELPMWVADMDFRTAPEIVEAIAKRVEHGVYGYSVMPEEWYDAYINWWSSRHGLTMKRDGLIFCTGVVPAISSIVRKLTTPAEKVLIQTPVYGVFFNCILNNGRQVIESPLSYNGKEFSIDFDDLEEKLSDPQTTLMILCNPHNPIGKIWDRETLAKIGALCKKHSVTVLSDEIHCDLTDPGCGYAPFASVNEECRDISVTAIAPTKTFNLAGLQTAAVYAYDKVLRHKVWRGLNTDEVAEPNAFAVTAAVAAFTKGEEWLNQLRQYIYENKAAVGEFLQSSLPQIKLVPSQATYLLWLDCGEVTEDSKELAEFIREETGLFLSHGNQYGGSGNSFLRLNIACPRETLRDGLQRLKTAVMKQIGLS